MAELGWHSWRIRSLGNGCIDPFEGIIHGFLAGRLAGLVSGWQVLVMYLLPRGNLPRENDYRPYVGGMTIHDIYKHCVA